MMFFKKINYGFYMICFRLKGIKYSYINKTKGEAAAFEYVKKTFYLWSKFTIKTIGIYTAEVKIYPEISTKIKVVVKEN